MAELQVELVDETAPDLEVLTMPSEYVEARPVDLDDCPRCEGQGMVVIHVDGGASYRLCSWCTGTGQRGAA